MGSCLTFIPRTFSIRLVIKISLSLEKFERKPREVGRVRSREWCDRDVQEMGEEEFRQNLGLSRGLLPKLTPNTGQVPPQFSTPYTALNISFLLHFSIHLWTHFCYFNWLCRHTWNVSHLGVQSSSGGNRLQSGRNGSGIFDSNGICACAVTFPVSTKTRTSLWTVYTGIFKSQIGRVLATYGPWLNKPRPILDASCFGDFVPFTRPVHVLFKSRLI